MSQDLYVTDRESWRAWLRQNHDKNKEVWLIYYRKHTGKPSILYDESVEEALCFGWVDSIIKKIDNEKFARKFTPRTSRSRWSEANKKRVEKMIKEGRMTETGLAIISDAKDGGQWFKTVADRNELVIPSYLRDALAADYRASHNFNNLAQTYKRNFVLWISSAKKEETRRKRLAEAMELLERNQKLGMK